MKVPPSELCGNALV